MGYGLIHSIFADETLNILIKFGLLFLTTAVSFCPSIRVLWVSRRSNQSHNFLLSSYFTCYFASKHQKPEKGKNKSCWSYVDQYQYWFSVQVRRNLQKRRPLKSINWNYVYSICSTQIRKSDHGNCISHIVINVCKLEVSLFL